MKTTQDKETDKATIARLESRICAECKTIDREERFNEMLDEIYSFEKVGGPFANMSPSRVLLEVDPVAHRCGVNDYEDSDGLVEIDGDYYEKDEAEKAKAEFLDELESEASDLESEIEDLVSGDGPVEDAAQIQDLQTALAAKRAEIETVEGHSF